MHRQDVIRHYKPGDLVVSNAPFRPWETHLEKGEMPVIPANTVGLFVHLKPIGDQVRMWIFLENKLLVFSHRLYLVRANWTNLLNPIDIRRVTGGSI